MTGRRFVAGFVILLFVLPLTGLACDGKTDGTKTKKDNKPLATKATIEIKDFAFKPDTVTVAVRSRITWTNKDMAQHTITGKNFDSGPINQGESYSFEFINPGTYAFRCTIHPYMEGTVIVK
jgi:plastocyanin